MIPQTRPTTAPAPLREAIDNANSPGIDTTQGDCVVATGNDTILFSVNGTIKLSGTLPAVSNNSPNTLTIDGTGQTITVDGTNLYRAFKVSPDSVLYLNGLAIAHGNAAANDDGGAGGALLNDGRLTVTGTAFVDNAAITGGGISNQATATLAVSNSSFADNQASGQGDAGGAINNDGQLSVSATTFDGNRRRWAARLRASLFRRASQSIIVLSPKISPLALPTHRLAHMARAVP